MCTTLAAAGGWSKSSRSWNRNPAGHEAYLQEKGKNLKATSKRTLPLEILEIRVTYHLRWRTLTRG
jgi:hypothetical protein